MNVPNPAPTGDACEPTAEASQTAAAEPPGEPSMDEILASIRRIIAQDQSLFAEAAAAAPEPSPALATEQNGAPASTIYGMRQAIEAEFTAQAAASPASCAGPHEGSERAAPLLSPAADASVATAFNALVASRFAENSDAVLTMTRDALHPLLENWLNANLPALVERLVRAEIERIARRG